MKATVAAEKHSILSQFYALMDGTDLLELQDSGAVQDVLFTMIDELQRRLQSISERSTVTPAASKETPLPF